jgi:hypothetical protein
LSLFRVALIAGALAVSVRVPPPYRQTYVAFALGAFSAALATVAEMLLPESPLLWLLFVVFYGAAAVFFVRAFLLWRGGRGQWHSDGSEPGGQGRALAAFTVAVFNAGLAVVAGLIMPESLVLWSLRILFLGAAAVFLRLGFVLWRRGNRTAVG